MAEPRPYDFDPDAIQPGDRLRITRAVRSGSDLAVWERQLAGRCGVVCDIRRDPDSNVGYCVVTLALDPLTPRQRTEHRVTLRLWSTSYPAGTWDTVERLSAEVCHG